jgi:branched-chain amino acid transport system ATP-binding protein
MNTLLCTKAVSRRYAGLLAVDAVSLEVAAGSVHALIGPNGAGKTTLFNLISGLDRADDGRIHLAGRDITPLAAHRRAALGLARTFQAIRVFGAMTALENVLTGLHTRRRAGLFATVLRTGGFRREERALLERARAALALVGLDGRAEEPAGALSYGEQRRLEIARALAPEPTLLLLDEPAAGMNPAETEGLARLVGQIRALGITVLVVEHDIGFVMDIADTVTVLNFGRRIFSGPPAAARADDAVLEAYLGQKVAARLATRKARR